MQKTYFYERSDGSIFACEAKEAAIAHRFHKQIGVSDGSAFEKVMQEARMKHAKLKYKPDKRTKKNDLMDAAYKKAFATELKKARGHIEVPGNTSVIVMGASPEMARRITADFLGR